MSNRFTVYIKSFFGVNKMSLRQYLKNILVRFKEDSLFQNSVYLITSTVAMSIFGFVFWIITTRLYSTTQIGFATALISATILLSNFSLFGFNTGIVRFLPKAEKPNTIINTAITMVTSITILISTAYVFAIKRIAPQFILLKSIPLYGVLFVLFMVMVSVNMLTDSVFIAYRASKYNFIEYIFFGLAKVSLPILLVTLGTYGIFFAYIGAVIVALIVTLYFLIKKFQYRPQIVVSTRDLKNMAGFSIGNYAGSFIGALPLLILPTLIVLKIGPSYSAYFYIASTIASLLYGIPVAVAQSLLAEGSHNEHEMKSFVISASKLLGVILSAGVIAFIALGKYVLLIFGKNYAQHSFILLVIMAVTSFFIAANTIGDTVLRIRHQIKELVWINIGYVIVTLVLIALLLPHGIVGAGWALFFGQVLMSIEFILFYILGKRTWQDIEYFDMRWSNRIEEMARYIPASKSVLDLGCGKMWLKKYLKDNPYYPVDYTSRGEETIICDFNNHQFPTQQADIAFVSGTLEYIHDAQWFISTISQHCNQCILSYCVTEDYPNKQFRRKQAWVNAYSRNDIVALFFQAGFTLHDERQTVTRNTIFNFIKKPL